MLSRWMPRPSKPMRHRNGSGGFDPHTFPPFREENPAFSGVFSYPKNASLVVKNHRKTTLKWQSAVIVSLSISHPKSKFQPYLEPIPLKRWGSGSGVSRIPILGKIFEILTSKWPISAMLTSPRQMA